MSEAEALADAIEEFLARVHADDMPRGRTLTHICYLLESSATLLRKMDKEESGAHSR